ncbi:hypothetical protein [Methylophaga nitratireducenticrescens]|uniref:hypothetical protein n=1 Tax=Methylophaga nitratireducenticrescens TaxID=754476 RepID=UPI000CDCD6EB|nr:hypothetical protein [Methylophaga nitratireducenticrescens]AUZ84761.1 hypothetical protein CDW43_09320 [Methylophaga nitratireducenticrescens]
MPKPVNLIINREGSWADFSRWLVRGGAATDARWFYRDATDETWQNIVDERLPFIEVVKRHFDLEIIRGASESTIHSYASDMNVFIKWVDENNVCLSLNEESIEEAFFRYDEYNYLRAWGRKEIKPISAYRVVFRLAQVLSDVLNRPPHAQFKYFSKVIKAYKSPRKTSISYAGEKQHLGDSQMLGYFCVDIANALTIEAIYGPLPITISVLKPRGSTQTIQIPLGLVNLLNHTEKQTSNRAKSLCEPTKIINKFRTSIIRIRLLADFVIFVYQTGMNVSQVLQIERKAFSYKLQGNSDWLVTNYKGRKRGTVKFTIYKKYRERFKSLIKFVDHFYPDTPYLFPLTYKSSIHKGTVNYQYLKRLAERNGVSWIPPRTSRNTRANFLDRMIGDPDLSSEMSQHVKETFGKNYDRPSQHRAMSALTHFWNKKPFSLINSGCDGQPKPTVDKPSDIISPNCINESGCLWCKSHRDIESEDYVWSLVSFRHLKLIEAAQPIKREIPADVVVDRLHDKLEAFKSHSEQSYQWLEEALIRIEEGNYHPTWENIIKFWESP